MRCGYCKYAQGWDHSPHGRPYCPRCGAIPTEHQREFRDGKPIVEGVNHA